MQKYTVTMKVIKRYEIIKDWLRRKINGKEASILLGVSYRHARRLKKAFKDLYPEQLFTVLQGNSCYFSG